MVTMSEAETFEARLARVLREDLAKAGVEAEIRTEPIEHTRMHRVMVISPSLEGLQPSERQDLVWRIVQRHFTRDDDLRISTILTLTPDDVAPAADD